MRDFQRELDRVKIAVFRGKNSAFYGSLLSSMEIRYAPQNAETANIFMDEMVVELNDAFFAQPAEVQETILVHELNHIARLHNLRRGNRDQKTWDKACDIEINNHLKREKYGFDGLNPNMNSDYVNLPAEDIYKLLKADDDDGDDDWNGDTHQPSDPNGSSGNSSESIIKQITALEKAKQMSNMQNEHVDMGEAHERINDIMKKFKKPVVSWGSILRRFMTELFQQSYTFSRPNRRHEDVYLPSLEDEDGKLAKVAFYMDVSGSVSEAEQKTCINEFAHIKRTFNPDEISLIQFDTDIVKEDTFTSSQRLKAVEFVNGGGTDLRPVHDHIVATKPKIVVIMSDLEVYPMEPIKGVDIIWLCVNNPTAKVNQGKMIHITVDKYGDEDDY